MGSVSLSVLLELTGYKNSCMRMWVEYGPSFPYGCSRSKPAYQVKEPHPYCSDGPRFQTGTRYFPNYRSYIDAMCEGDFFYLGYKQVTEPPPLKKINLSGLPYNVSMRWTV